MKLIHRAAWVWLVVSIVALPLLAAEKSAKELTTDSAVFLLRHAMQVSRDGRHNVLLRALRQLGDPALEPYFSELFQSDQPSLKIHGILGLAECSPGKKLALVRLASIENAAVQAEGVSTAMDSDLLSNDQAKEIFNWPGLDNAVKVLVAAPLVKAGTLPSLDPLKEGAKSDNIGRRGVALLLLLQSGDPTAAAEMQKLDESKDPKRDPVREMMLGTALRYEFAKAAGWAAKVAAEPGVSSRLGLLALRVALRLGAPNAAALWSQQYESNTDPSHRTRLALIALQDSSWVRPELFNALKRSDDPLLRQIGVVGAAVAAKKPIAEPAVALVKLSHPIADNWAMGYARKLATDDEARAILTALINNARGGPEETRTQRLDDAVAATRLLAERSPDAATAFLRPILADSTTEQPLVEAILLGLASSDASAPQKVIDGLPPFANPEVNNLALVLAAKHGVALSPGQLRDLSLVVRGGGKPQDSIRIQAAWIYLKLTGQTKSALAAVIGGNGK